MKLIKSYEKVIDKNIENAKPIGTLDRIGLIELFKLADKNENLNIIKTLKVKIKKVANELKLRDKKDQILFKMKQLLH